MSKQNSGGRRRLSENARVALLGLPGAIYFIVFLALPMVSIVIFSFWRTEIYEMIPDWNIENYREIIGKRTYWVFFFRSLWTSLAVCASCILIAWPCCYFLVRTREPLRTFLCLLFITPWFMGIILRIIALQGIMGPNGVINMGLMKMNLPTISWLMYDPIATFIGLIFMWIPFMLTAIYLSLLNFDFELVEVAKINGARPMRCFFEVTWPLNWLGTVIGTVAVFVPCMADDFVSMFFGGPRGASYGMILNHQFVQSGTWAFGSAMGVVLLLICAIVIFVGLRTINLTRSGFTGAGR